MQGSNVQDTLGRRVLRLEQSIVNDNRVAGAGIKEQLNTSAPVVKAVRA